MIRIKSPLFSEEIKIEDSSLYKSIIIENKRLFFLVCQFLHCGFSGETVYFSFLDGLSEEIEPAYFLETPFELNLNSKANLNLLYKRLKAEYFGKLDHELSGVGGQIQKAVEDIALDYEVPLTCNDSFSMEDLFKIMGVRFQEAEEIGIHPLVSFMSTVHELSKKSVFFTMGLRNYFDDSEIVSLYRELEYRHISIIDISVDSRLEKLPFESRIIIDSDLCDF